MSTNFLKTAIGSVLLATPAFPLGESMTFERVASGLSSPVFVTHAPGDATRLFIVQRSGQIRILDLTSGILSATNFITVPGVASGGERGLLGLAFHPDYQSNGLFYVNYTDNTGGDTRVQQFSRTNADTADPTSAVDIIEIDQPQTNHNGGWLGFDMDGFLNVAVGDGGAGNDSGTGHTAATGNAQDITNNLLGKILRLDIDGDDFPADPARNYAIPPDNPFVGTSGDDEIFLYGLRNPWRCSFDRLTGDLWMGDVGQGAREEIDVYLYGSDADKNYGWRLREGTIATPNSVGGSRPSDNVDPVYDYLHGSGPFQGNSTTGGYVYRGPITAFQGHYLFGDFVSNRIFSFKFDGTTPFDGSNTNFLRDWTSTLTTNVGSIVNISSFGEDLDGNLYVVDFTGEVFRLIDVVISTELSFCASGTNGATISSNGNVSVALNDFQLKASPVPNSFGLFYFGGTQQQVPFGLGFRCVGPPIFRISPAQLATGATAARTLDFFAPTQFGQPNNAVQIDPGECWYFQYWFRDGANFDLSDGLLVQFGL